jgi:hypothetical protein
MKRYLNIFECYIEPDPQGRPVVKYKKLKGTNIIIKADSVDDAIKEGKEILAKMGKKVRSINIDIKKNVHAIVDRGKRVSTSNTPKGWRFRRPNNQKL